MAEDGVGGIWAIMRGVLTRRRLASIAVLGALPVVQYALFAPLYSDIGSTIFPLMAVLALLVVGLGCSLLAYRFLRKERGTSIPMQELGLFALGGVTSLISLMLFSAAGPAGMVSRALSVLVSLLLLLLASVLHSRLMEARASFFAPLVLGTAWPMLVPFQKMVETLFYLTPWVFDGLTLSAMAALLLICVLAVCLKASVPITLRYVVLWAAAVLMMVLVPFHEVFGLFSNMVYGSVDRSIAVAGLLVGVSALSFFLRANYRAHILRQEIEKGDELRRGGHHLEAILHYDRAIGIDRELVHAWTRKELALRAAGADVEAQKALREVLRLQPDSEGALNELGVIARRQGKLKEALGHFNRTLEKNPSFVVAWNNKGNTLQNLHQLREAIKCYDRALELNPAFEAAFVNKARALASLGKFRPALEALDKALELRPTGEALWNEKGLVYMKLASFERALAHFDKALKLNERFEAAWNNKGNALSKLGRTAEALRCYNRALQLNVEYYAAWYNEGSALIDSGDIQGAIKCLDEALKLNPGSDVAWNERGVALRKLGKLTEAEEHFKRAIQLNPGYPAAWNNRGNILMDQGRTSEAFQCYNVATMIDPKYDKAWYNKGCALLAMGKAEDALKAFERSVGASLQASVDAGTAARESALMDRGPAGAADGPAVPAVVTGAPAAAAPGAGDSAGPEVEPDGA